MRSMVRDKPDSTLGKMLCAGFFFIPFFLVAFCFRLSAVGVSDLESTAPEPNGFPYSGFHVEMTADLGSKGVGMLSPWDLAAGLDGTVFVTDLDANNVTVLGRNGKPAFSFGRFGFEPGRIDGPEGIAADQTRNSVYVSDRGNSRVQVFDLRGNFLLVFNEIDLDEPAGIAVDYRGYVVVADARRDVLIRIDLEGKTETVMGGYGTGLGKLDEPRLLASDSGGNIWVWERDNRRIQKFSRAGVGMFTVSSFKSEKGTEDIKSVSGLAVDPKDNCWIWVPECRCALVLGSDGAVVGSVSVRDLLGSDIADEWFHDVGLEFSDGKRLMVLDRIQKKLFIVGFKFKDKPGAESQK